jgi:signal peptidase I
MLAERQGNASMELACGLTEELVRTFGDVRLRVFGTSMVPAILPGDLVSIHRACLNDICPGEIVLFLQMGRLFVHRVVDRKVMTTTSNLEEYCLITRGDRQRHTDPPVYSTQLLGRVVSIERDNRKVEVHSNRSNGLVVRVLQSSDQVTSLYLRVASCWRALFLRRAKCQV